MLVSLTYMGAQGKLLIPFPLRIPGERTVKLPCDMCCDLLVAGSCKGAGKAYFDDEMTLRGTGTRFTSEVEVGDKIKFYEYLPNGKMAQNVDEEKEVRVCKVNICKWVRLCLVNAIAQVISDTELEMSERLDYGYSEHEAQHYVISKMSIFTSRTDSDSNRKWDLIIQTLKVCPSLIA